MTNMRLEVSSSFRRLESVVEALVVIATVPDEEGEGGAEGEGEGVGVEVIELVADVTRTLLAAVVTVWFIARGLVTVAVEVAVGTLTTGRVEEEGVASLVNVPPGTEPNNSLWPPADVTTAEEVPGVVR